YVGRDGLVGAGLAQFHNALVHHEPIRRSPRVAGAAGEVQLPQTGLDGIEVGRGPEVDDTAQGQDGGLVDGDHRVIGTNGNVAAQRGVAADLSYCTRPQDFSARRVLSGDTGCNTRGIGRYLASAVDAAAIKGQELVADSEVAVEFEDAGGRHNVDGGI